MRISLSYGQRQLNVDLDDGGFSIQVLEPSRTANDPAQADEPLGLVRQALAAPIESPRLRELVRPGQSVAIVTSDVTRPCPSHLLLPPILDELAEAGVRDEQITVVLALGSHRPPTAGEREGLVGSEVANRVRCIDSDPRQVVHVGTTTRGTPIEMFEPVVNADVRVTLGNVEPHYFAGYSGGAKALVPGVCSLRTIERNHALMADPLARAGVLEGNPVREDLEEGAAFVGVDFILNIVLDSAHRVAYATAGHVRQAHRRACQAVASQSIVPIDRPADIVLVGAGGYPKDINMYQAQKALDNAAAAVRPEGVIVWVAECAEGLGHSVFAEWLEGSAPDQILTRLRQGFVLGGHKAAAIARVLKQATVYLVSELSPDLVRACGMEPYRQVEPALAAARQKVGAAPRLLVLPDGASVLVSVG